MLFLLSKKNRQRFLMCLYCIVIVIFYCPLREVFLYTNFQLGPRKSARCLEVSAKNCTLHRGFLIKTNPFLKKESAGSWCPL